MDLIRFSLSQVAQREDPPGKAFAAVDTLLCRFVSDWSDSMARRDAAFDSLATPLEEADATDPRSAVLIRFHNLAPPSESIAAWHHSGRILSSMRLMRVVWKSLSVSPARQTTLFALSFPICMALGNPRPISSGARESPVTRASRSCGWSWRRMDAQWTIVGIRAWKRDSGDAGHRSPSRFRLCGPSDGDHRLPRCRDCGRCSRCKNGAGRRNLKGIPVHPANPVILSTNTWRLRTSYFPSALSATYRATGLSRTACRSSGVRFFNAPMMPSIAPRFITSGEF